MTDTPAGSAPSRPSRPRRVRVRRARPDDVPAIWACQRAAYPQFAESGLCDERLLAMQVEAFPEGQLVAFLGDDVVGYATSLIVQLDDESPWYSYNEITGSGTFSTHDPTGDTLYGTDIAVHPDHRGQGVAGALYERRRRLLKQLNLRRMVAGGRIPGYATHAGRLTAEAYVEKVVAGEMSDPALNAHLKAGYRVRGIHMGYLRDDQSLDYATFLELENPSHRPARRKISATPMKRPVRKIRVCAAQYGMRRLRDWDDFEQQVDFFVKTAEEYHCHFLLFPELFTVQLFSTMPTGLTAVEAIEALADLTPRYRELFVDRARRSGLFIVAGSHPVRRDDGRIYNVAHLITPTGEIFEQDKLHVTPSERTEYGIQPGAGLRVFDTSHARVAILVCYDVEFPELPRLLTQAGAEVLFIPFSTDERRAYQRVRFTSHARAVENVIYCVLAGNVGNLPQVENFLINYGQAAIFTPSDFAFPVNAVAGEADFNTETVVIGDLDLAALELVREVGSVRPWRDRRTDLFDLKATPPVTLVRAR